MNHVDELQGKTLASVVHQDGIEGDVIIFTADNGDIYHMYHSQDCCEHVVVEDIVGDLQDLVGTPILAASEDSNRGSSELHESETWTYYRFRTIKGSVSIRWHGSSNGYYSESVNFEKQ